MASKNITVTEEAYERLAEHKREGESFTDVVLRLAGDERDVMSGFGAMADVDGFREEAEATRDDLDDSLRERA